MESAPLVSIVVPFFGAERFIAEAIESVLAQAYSRWELLLVDDGSRDGGPDIARRYAERHPARIRCLAHPGGANRGESAARNLGLRHARGDYVALLDADDVWLPEKLARQVALMEAEPAAGMVYGAPEYWRSWTGDPADRDGDHVPGVPVPPGSLVPPPDLLLASYPLGKGPAPCPSDLLLRRAALDRAGGFEESFHGIYQLYEDQAFLAKVYLHTSVLVTAERWTRYRLQPHSCMARVEETGQYHVVRRRFLEWIEGYLAAEGNRDPRIQRALLAALHPYRASRAARAAGWARPRAGRLARALVPVRVRAVVAGRARGRHAAPPPVGHVRFGHLRRLEPISREFGFDRGLPVDRHYIESFLARHAGDVRGRVLEVGDDAYTRRFGGGRVTTRDVFHVEKRQPGASFCGDLADAPDLPSGAFDCVILTQTLHLIYDLRAALATLYRILRPGGVLLLTVPGISQLSTDQWADYWCWSFTKRSLGRLLGEAFPGGTFEVEAHGSVLAAVAFLHGLAREELTEAELAHRDPAYELLVTARAVKAREGA